ncbi:hypothetical protein N9850_11270 [Granulosicoccus sp.]|nr:hypothetical protein [Granulosicoccus sp.]MDB4224345.1 hypothetical protein [Granulosicoccus sp.]
MNGVRTTRSSKSVVQHLALVWLLAMVLSIISTQSVFGQSIDTVAPIIELEELAEGEADLTQVFTVLIAEDVLLRDAALYYRREGQLPFTPAPMQALGDTGYYSVSIPTDKTDLRTIEYYVQARDEAGNRTVSGFAFDPYQRRLKPSSKITSSSSTQTTVQPIPTPPEEPNAPPLLKQRWVQVTLGVVAVGILASMASGGGSDSQVVPLTFNLQ